MPRKTHPGRDRTKKEVAKRRRLTEPKKDAKKPPAWTGVTIERKIDESQ